MSKHKKLSFEERQRIQVLLEKGVSKRGITKVINRSASTVIEEIKRNRSRILEVLNRMSPYERAADSQQRSVVRRQKGQHQRRWKLARKDKAAWEYVIEQVQKRTSPKKIYQMVKKKSPAVVFSVLLVQAPMENFSLSYGAA